MVKFDTLFFPKGKYFSFFSTLYDTFGKSNIISHPEITTVVIVLPDT